jgi:hypothetical protein
VLYGGVAISTVDAQYAYVVLVAEGNRLNDREFNAGPIGTAGYHQPGPGNSRQQQCRHQRGCPGNHVHPAGEDLRHPCILSSGCKDAPEQHIVSGADCEVLQEMPDFRLMRILIYGLMARVTEISQGCLRIFSIVGSAAGARIAAHCTRCAELQ